MRTASSASTVLSFNLMLFAAGVVVVGAGCTPAICDCSGNGPPGCILPPCAPLLGEGEGEVGEGEGEGEVGEGEGEVGEGEGEVAIGRAFNCALDQTTTLSSQASCTTADDCTITQTFLDCCGTARPTGIRKDDLTAFEAAYDVCPAAHPACDCLGETSSGDDATLSTGAGDPTVGCVHGLCTTSYGGGDRDLTCPLGGALTPEASCDTEADCSFALVQVNCCGSMLATGISAQAQKQTEASEAQCASAFPECGCASVATVADDGTSAPTLASSPVAGCVNHLCTTTFAP